MTPPTPSPQLSKWIFFATDVVLLAAAALIAARADQPLSPAAIFAIVACVIAGAIVATIPLLVHYEREKNRVLDERQQALEALARTVANSAEQISIAASGLHQIAELTQKNLRHAEQLPHKLQDKIAEFQAQLANADATEKEELEQELTSLRTTESERLASISDKIAKSTADWAKLEATAHKNASSLHDALIKAHAQAAAALDDKLRATLAALDSRLGAFEKTALAASAASTPAPADNLEAAVTAPLPAPTPTTIPPAPPAKRTPRKSTGKDSGPVPSLASSPATSPGFAPEEPPPLRLLEITPIAPDSKSPYPPDVSGNESPATTASLPPTESAPPTGTPKLPRKRSDKNSAASDNTLSFELPAHPANTAVTSALSASPLSDFTQVSPDEATPTAALAADGATRLLITAYIGIGNRLFIRGEGPGLSWEKGVPLQFVSIGKWRWETSDATAPVQFKLYKNDELECTTLGQQTLAPGYQQEFAATF